MEIAEYRRLILQCLLEARDDKGNAVLDDQEANDLLALLSDEELLEGIDFNTPQDVADVLIEWNPDK